MENFLWYEAWMLTFKFYPPPRSLNTFLNFYILCVCVLILVFFVNRWMVIKKFLSSRYCAPRRSLGIYFFPCKDVFFCFYINLLLQKVASSSHYLPLVMILLIYLFQERMYLKFLFPTSLHIFRNYFDSIWMVYLRHAYWFSLFFSSQDFGLCQSHIQERSCDFTGRNYCTQGEEEGRNIA